MEEVLQFGGFLLMDYAAMVVYAKRAVRYSKSLLDAQRPENSAAFYGASLLFLWMVVFSGLPVIVIFLFLYSALLLYFPVSYTHLKQHAHRSSSGRVFPGNR